MTRQEQLERDLWALHSDLNRLVALYQQNELVGNTPSITSFLGVVDVLRETVDL